jgi:hypothetical protein
MAFEYPSTITARKEKKKNKKPVTTKGNTVKEEKENQKLEKIFKPVFDKPDSLKRDIAIVQLDDAFSRTEGSEKILKDKSKLKKIVDAAADDKQLERSERRMMRNMSGDAFKKGGRAGYKGGKSVKKKSGCAIRGRSPILR